MFIRRASAISFVFSIAAAAAANPPKLRLAEVQNIQPRHYDVQLSLDPDRNTFSGTVQIQIDIAAPVDTVWLNQQRLQISKASIELDGKDISAQILPAGEDFVGLHFNNPLPAGGATAKITWTGIINEKSPDGIFARSDSGNHYIFSQFEPTDARAAFPCFDEPSYKAQWQLTLHIPDRDTAVSNTSIASEKTSAGIRTIVFQETKPLPSYLVAFAVGPFEFVDAGTAGKAKTPVRIIVPKGRTAEARYAAEVTPIILSRLEDYFGIPFPFEKADQVAIPSFPGAMENAGMLTYAQAIILADPKADSLGRERMYVTVAAHELAHQWFGDLVTTAWWDDIWLNEAFATWMERKLTAEWKPEWKTRIQDVGAKLGAEQKDSLASARMIRQKITSRNDINNAFDDITYEKGASVIGMFESWLGPEEFRKAVRQYLEHYALHATTAADFLDSLTSSTGKAVNQAFATFLNQPGVPVVKVSLDCRVASAGDSAKVRIEQQRFVPTGSGASSNALWQVPFCFRYGSSQSSQAQCALVTHQSESIDLKAGSCPTWFNANDQAVGYYRVDYQPPLLAALTAGDVERRLSAEERVEVMGNTHALAAAGKLSAADALALAETFHNDPETDVVSMALAEATAPADTLVPRDLVPNYRRFLQKNFGKRSHELGWMPRPGESENTRLLRPTLLRVMATLGGDQELAEQARQLTQKLLAGGAGIDPDVRNAVLRTAAFHGDSALFQQLLTVYRKTPDTQQQQSLISAMSGFRNRQAIEAEINALIKGEIPFLEGFGSLIFMPQAPDIRMLRLNLIIANWDRLSAKLPQGGGFIFGQALPQAGAGLCDATSRDRFKDFVGPKVNQFEGAPRVFDQVVESINLCIANKAAQTPATVAFLKNY